MTYVLDSEEREERRQMRADAFADRLAEAAALATKFDEHVALLMVQAEPQDRTRLAATVNRIDTFLIAEELNEWAKEADHG